MTNPFREVREFIRRQDRAPTLILLYHRVTRLERDPWALSVTPEQFASQLAMIRRHSLPVALRDLDSAAKAARLPRVAITFDDGYQDNLLEAEPLLRQFEIPATVFVVSGAVTTDGEFWWDELERILFERRTAEKSIRVAIRGAQYTWTLDDNACRCCDLRWHAWEHASQHSCKHRVYSDLYELLFPLCEAQRIEVLERLRNWAGLDQAGRPSHRPLSRDQIRDLQESRLIEIGVHSVSHPSLAALPASAQEKEVFMSKRDIEDATGRNALSFSYPFGKAEHFSEVTVDIVRSAGFRYACSNIPGLVRESSDPLRLPRVIAPGLAGEAFARWLSDCFHTLN